MNNDKEKLNKLFKVFFKEIDHLTGGEMFSSNLSKKPEIEKLEKLYNEIKDILGEKEYEIWSEGYRCTGNSSGAILMGKEEGKTFKEACIKFFSKDGGDSYFNPNAMTYWGCKLFDNEEDARRNFG